jgi:hypothetical protein
MPNPDENGRAKTQQPSSDVENAQLSVAIEELRTECDGLRKALARAEEERDLYLKAVYEYERERALASREFEDIDIDALKAMSAGPVETIE